MCNTDVCSTAVSTKLTPVTLSRPGHHYAVTQDPQTGLTRTETPANACCRVKTKPKLNQININMSFFMFYKLDFKWDFK